MAGTTVTIEFDAQSALGALTRAAGAMSDPAPLLGELGEELLDIHAQRFRDQISPLGDPWAPLQPWYQAQKQKNADKVLTLDGYLRNLLHWQIRAGELLFGTNVIYGAIHQFGGTIKPKTAGALNVGGHLVRQVVIPARPWLGVSVAEREWLLEVARQHIESLIR